MNMLETNENSLSKEREDIEMNQMETSELKMIFTALDLASITSHIHSRVLFLLWFHPFILSGVISH